MEYLMAIKRLFSQPNVTEEKTEWTQPVLGFNGLGFTK